jgi:hypothetical protein
MVRVEYETGTRNLPRFTPPGKTPYVTFVCLGPGKMALGNLFDIAPCDGKPATTALQGQTGHEQALTVKADASTAWRILITSGS